MADWSKMVDASKAMVEWRNLKAQRDEAWAKFVEFNTDKNQKIVDTQRELNATLIRFDQLLRDAERVIVEHMNRVM